VTNAGIDEPLIRNPLPPLIREPRSSPSVLARPLASATSSAAPQAAPAGTATAQTTDGSVTSASTPAAPSTPGAADASREAAAFASAAAAAAAEDAMDATALAASAEPSRRGAYEEVFALEGAEDSGDGRDRGNSSPLGFVSAGAVSAPAPSSSSSKPRARQLTFDDEKAAGGAGGPDAFTPPRALVAVAGGGDFSWSTEDKHALVRLSGDGYTATNSVGYAAKVGATSPPSPPPVLTRAAVLVCRAWRGTRCGRAGGTRSPCRWRSAAAAPSASCRWTSTSGRRVSGRRFLCLSLSLCMSWSLVRLSCSSVLAPPPPLFALTLRLLYPFSLPRV
jgi:hypothetical protein